MATPITRHTAMLMFSLLLVLTLVALMVSAYVYYPEAIDSIARGKVNLLMVRLLR